MGKGGREVREMDEGKGRQVGRVRESESKERKR